MGETVTIPMHLIGWNEKGFVGFMDGGTHLSYVESSEERKKYLPYISDKTVKEVNKYGADHPEVFKKKEEIKDGSSEKV